MHGKEIEAVRKAQRQVYWSHTLSGQFAHNRLSKGSCAVVERRKTTRVDQSSSVLAVNDSILDPGTSGRSWV